MFFFLSLINGLSALRPYFFHSGIVKCQYRNRVQIFFLYSSFSELLTIQKCKKKHVKTDFITRSVDRVLVSQLMRQRLFPTTLEMQPIVTKYQSTIGA